MKERLVFIDDNPIEAEKFKNRVLRVWQMDKEIVTNNLLLKPQNNSDEARQKFCDGILNFVHENNDGSIEAIILDVFFDYDGSEKNDPLGYELGRVLRTNFPQIPIILYTVNEKIDASLNAFNFDGYIVKTNFLAGENTLFASSLYNAKQRRERVLEECHHLGTQIKTKIASNPIILHISDIHRGLQTEKEDNKELFESTFQSLTRDIRAYAKESISQPNIIVVSGDITRRGSIEGYAIAKEFLLKLAEFLEISKKQVVICPGNHDLDRKISRIAYDLDPDKTEDKQQDILPNEYYKFRFAPFKFFFDDFYNGDFVYSLEDNKSFTIFHYADLFNLVVVGFNSCERTDHLIQNRNKSFISLDTIKKAKETLSNLNLDKYLKIAVWHHPLIVDFDNNLGYHDRVLQELSESGFLFYLHGHAHAPENRPYSTRQTKTKLHQWGAGTIGVPSIERPEDIPRHYEILELDFSKNFYTVYSRQRIGLDWKPCPSFENNKSNITIKFPKLQNK